MGNIEERDACTMTGKNNEGEAAEKRDWDGTIKAWAHENPQIFVSWLRKGATFKRLLATELKKITDFDGDDVIEIEENGKKALMEVEFQSTYRRNLGDRLLLYNDLVSALHSYKPVWSYLIYLSDQGQPSSKSPAQQSAQEVIYTKKMPSGKEIKRLYYTRINMWEVPMSELRELKLDGLLPLIPLSKDGENLDVIEEMAEELKGKQKYNLLTIAKSFTEFRLGDKIDQAWIERVFYMSRDILDNTPTIRRAKQEVLEEERLRNLQEQRQLFHGIVQGRFPELVELAKRLTEGITDPAVFQTLTLQVGIAPNSQVAEQAITALYKSNNKTA